MTPQQFVSLKERANIFRNDSVEIRLNRLKTLLSWVEKHEEEIITALKLDFNKPKFETQLSEIYPCISEIKHTIKKLRCWMRDENVSNPWALFGHKSYIRHENKGVVLIIGPWNYPFQIVVVPLAAALAAGNTVVIKPSELTPHTAELLKKMAEDCFYSNEVLVEIGGKEKNEELLKYDFDHVFFTGSTSVGRIIADSCAKRLIPVTLELGGKSPTIIDETADLDDAAEKIFWAKFLNRGQTCIAPDYLVLQESIAPLIIEKLKSLTQKNQASEKAHIISDRHHQRLQNMLTKIVDLNKNTLEIVEIANVDHPTMKDEIFGPILPYLKYKKTEDLKNLILTKDKPLSLYVFSSNNNNINFILNTFTSGSAGINAVAVQYGNHYLPFGGVGASGIGACHGHFGFKEFSHQRAVIKNQFFKFSRKALMPPYSSFHQKIYQVLKKII